MTDYAPAPPDQTVWWDEAAVVTAVLDVLRLTDTDVDADRIAGLVPVAGARINDVLDRADPVSPPATPVNTARTYLVLEHPDDGTPLDVAPLSSTAPAPLQAAIVQVTVEMYRAKDAPPSSIDGLLAASWRPASVDPVAGVRAMINPYKQRFGIG